MATSGVVNNELLFRLPLNEKGFYISLYSNQHKTKPQTMQTKRGFTYFSRVVTTFIHKIINISFTVFWPFTSGVDRLKMREKNCELNKKNTSLYVISYNLGQNKKNISTSPKQNKDGKIARVYLHTALSLI